MFKFSRRPLNRTAFMTVSRGALGHNSAVGVRSALNVRAGSPSVKQVASLGTAMAETWGTTDAICQARYGINQYPPPKWNFGISCYGHYRCCA